MNQAKNLIIAVIVAVGLAALNGRSASFPDAWAKKLDLSIREVCPEAQIQASNNVFTERHGTTMFTLHKTSKGGEIFPETYQVEGPDSRGFHLTVTLAPGRYQGAAIVPQTLQGPCFPTFIDAPVAEDSQGYYSVRFSYGDALDEKIRNAIFATIPRTVLPCGATNIRNAFLGTNEFPVPADVSTSNSPPAIAAAIERGAANAAKDIEAGRLRIFHFGKPWPVGMPLVDDATGYRVEILEGCVVTEAFAAEVTAYNETMRQWHRANSVQQAVALSSDIVVARVLEISPVGHGSNSVVKSFQIEPTGSLKGTNLLSEAWVTYALRYGQPGFGSEVETELRKHDERIFLIRDRTLLRVEPLSAEPAISNLIQKASIPHGKYSLSIARVYESNQSQPEWVIIVGGTSSIRGGETVFRSFASLKQFIATLPSGSTLDWWPTCRGEADFLKNDVDELKDICAKAGIALNIHPSD